MSIKATRRRMISCYAQIINGYVQGYKIPELVKHEKIKARKLSYASQMYLLMPGQFLHVFSLNELVDISKIHARELSHIRGITPANLNTFSNANRTRNPSVMEKFFWMMYDHFRSQDVTFFPLFLSGEYRMDFLQKQNKENAGRNYFRASRRTMATRRTRPKSCHSHISTPHLTKGRISTSP